MSDTFRKVYKPLSDDNKQLIEDLKNNAEYIEHLLAPIKSREISLAMTYLETAIMWGVKGICINAEKE